MVPLGIQVAEPPVVAYGGHWLIDYYLLLDLVGERESVCVCVCLTTKIYGDHTRVTCTLCSLLVEFMRSFKCANMIYYQVFQ